jgi:hypothetical protein
MSLKHAQKNSTTCLLTATDKRPFSRGAHAINNDEASEEIPGTSGRELYWINIVVGSGRPSANANAAFSESHTLQVPVYVSV